MWGAPVRGLAAVALAVRMALEAAGARGIAIEVEAVDEIPRTGMGKAPLVRRVRPNSAGPMAS